MEPKKYGQFYNVYPHTENVCHKLTEILKRLDLQQFEKVNGVRHSEIMSYLDPYSGKQNIPGTFIQQLYECTNFDIYSLNKLAYPKLETPDSNTNPAVSFSDDVRKQIRAAIKDVHNYQLFADIVKCMSFPKKLDLHVRCIFHCIIELCSSMPYYQLLKELKDEERISTYINNNFSDKPNTLKKTQSSDDPSTIELPYIKDKEEFEKQSIRQQLLQKAQRAHFVNADYVSAKKLYLNIIKKYPESEECYIACLSLLSIHKSPYYWHLELESTTIEARIIKRLTQESVWQDTCEILKKAISDKRTKGERKRTPLCKNLISLDSSKPNS